MSRKKRSQVSLTKVHKEIKKVCDGFADFLITKNRKYGNSALEPIRIFSKADPLEQLYVRLDDKLSRIVNRQQDEDEDVGKDLVGYLILTEVYKRLYPQNIKKVKNKQKSKKKKKPKRNK